MNLVRRPFVFLYMWLQTDRHFIVRITGFGVDMWTLKADAITVALKVCLNIARGFGPRVPDIL